MRLLIATTNAHKTAEIRAMLGPAWEVRDLREHPEIEPAEETGETFEENAGLKAQAASHAVEGLVMADDSGLEVDALSGAPGVRSARYAGEGADDAQNRAKLLRALAASKDGGDGRRARFRCVIALARGGRVLASFDGAVEGRILSAERGEDGFGYDALFVAEGEVETFAEMASEAKNAISHRARALAKAAAFLAQQAG